MLDTISAGRSWRREYDGEEEDGERVNGVKVGKEYDGKMASIEGSIDDANCVYSCRSPWSTGRSTAATAENLHGETLKADIDGIEEADDHKTRFSAPF